MQDRTADIMKQGCMKRLLPPKGTALTRRIKTIKTSLAGKNGFQSDWALSLLREELIALTR
jgi:hypothetical protein